MKVAATPHPKTRQEELEQFLTAAPLAGFMASMFGPLPSVVRLLDAGAGAGALTSAFVACLCGKNEGYEAIEATLYEIDPQILDALSVNMLECQRLAASAGIRFTFTIHSADFIEEMAARLAVIYLKLRRPSSCRDRRYRGEDFPHSEKVCLRDAGFRGGGTFSHRSGCEV
jgi:adenine-specific DNA-methyltransferase